MYSLLLDEVEWLVLQFSCLRPIRFDAPGWHHSNLSMVVKKEFFIVLVVILFFVMWDVTIISMK